MVRVKAPLFSLEASGTIGGSIVFSRWKGRDYVRRHAIPSNPRTGLQVGVRSVFGFIAKDWANLLDADVADWTAAAAADNVTPLNAQIRDGVDRARRNLGWRQNTTSAHPANVAPPENLAVTAQPRTLVLTWEDAVANAPDYCYAIHRGEDAEFTADISNLIGVVPIGADTFTDIGLTPGTTYYYKLVGLSASGKKSAASAAANAQPKA